jgi:transcriptional regulator with XRE-family HTH domain
MSPRSDPTERKALIGARLRTAREMAGLSQGQVARMMDLHRPSVGETEAGRRGVSAEELARYSEIYGVTSAWLLGEVPGTLPAEDPRVQLAARELGKLRREDLDRVLQLLAALRSSEPEAK